MSALIPCMGGWCTRRDKCPNHFSTAKRQPSERLCPTGQDGAGEECDSEPIRRVIRIVGTWERGNRGLLVHATPFDGLGAHA